MSFDMEDDDVPSTDFRSLMLVMGGKALTSTFAAPFATSKACTRSSGFSIPEYRTFIAFFSPAQILVQVQNKSESLGKDGESGAGV